jgi:hypothetical protein
MLRERRRSSARQAERLRGMIYNILRSPASKEAYAGGGSNGDNYAPQSIVDLQTGVEHPFTDAAGDTGDEVRTSLYKHVF